MKNTFKTLLSLLLVLVMVFSVAGCGNSGAEESTPTNAVDDDFFTDVEDEIETSSEAQTSSETDSKTESNNDGQNTSGTDSKTEQTSSGDKTESKNEQASSEVSNKDETSSQATSNAAPTVDSDSWEGMLASMPKSLRGSKLVVVNWNPVSEYTGASAAIKEFEKQTGISVEWTTVEHGVYTTRLATMVASNNSPDVVRTRTPNPAWLQSFQSIDAAKFDFSGKVWDQTLMKDYTVNGVTYATSLVGTHIGSVDMMFYNKDLISKYDYEDPYALWKSGKWTMNKFVSMCKDFKKDSGEDYGCTGIYWQGWSQLYGIAGPVGYDGSKYYSNLSDSKFLTVTQQIADWYNTDNVLAVGRAEVFDAAQSLFYAGGSVYLRRNNSYFGSLKSAGTLYVVPMPAIDGQSKYYQGKDEYEAYAIARGAKNPEAVPYFLRYYLDPENYDLNAFFCNKQNLEVYEWCMSQKNTIWSTYYENTEDTFADKKEGLTGLQGNQVKSFLDSNSYMIDNRVKNFNKLVSQLKK